MNDYERYQCMWNPIVGETKEEIRGCCPANDLDCLVIRKGRRHIEHLKWNDHHEVWDDADGDDYACDMDGVDWWWAFPSLPEIENCK